MKIGTMQIGFNAPTSGPLIEPDSFISIITEGESLGFDYVTISDHIMVPRNLESKYPYTGSQLQNRSDSVIFFANL
jgi:hypothetical protein